MLLFFILFIRLRVILSQMDGGMDYIVRKKCIPSLIQGAPFVNHHWKEHFLFISKTFGEAWDFADRGEPQASALREPGLDQF